MADPNQTDSGSFEDPLENYDVPKFDDPVEQALHDKTVESIQAQPMTCIDASTSVRETMKLMVGRQITCVLVQEDGKLVGIFGDRDVLDKVCLEYDDVIDGPIRAVMTANPVFVHQHDSTAKVLSIMAVSGLRHVPVIDADQRPIGIVSPQRMTQFLPHYLA